MKLSLSRGKKSVKSLRETKLFQADWYLQTYPEVALQGIDPYEHYVTVGEENNYNPNRYFDVAWYKERSQAARKYDGLVLEHYAKRGWKNKVNPSSQFSGRLYLKHHSDVADQNINPLVHYLHVGIHENRLIFPVEMEYGSNPDLIEDMALIHESGLFKGDWYKQYYTDLWNYPDCHTLAHFMTTGTEQNRHPNPFFETYWYKNAYKKLIKKRNPFAYFISEGLKLGHEPSPKFCSEVYFDQHPDVKADGVSAFAHYVTKGMLAGHKFPDKSFMKASTNKNINKKATLPLPKHLRDMIDLPRNSLAPKSNLFDAKAMDIHWVIPDFAAGGGGHMTIFRMINHLERAGHTVTVWINNPSIHATPDDAYDTIVKHFQAFKGQVHFVDADQKASKFKAASGDAIIATDCWTVWPAMVPTNFKKRFYFVQDFEPSFHAMGAHYLAAEQSYKEDFDCICASPWLADIMREKYGRTASYFWLAADNALYTPPQNHVSRDTLRIAVYARHFTARRAVELAFLALEKLADRGLEFHVDFFGAPLPFVDAPFPYTDHGVASPKQLAAIFQNADVGVVFSATNYSLVPQEMMACKLPILELSGENTHAIFPDDVATFAAPDPRAIADGLEKLITDQTYRQQQADRAYDWVQGFSWEQSAAMVETAILDGLKTAEAQQTNPTKTASHMKASVVIPTYNAGDVLKPVLDMVTHQEAPWPYEILVIDSGSSDGTVELVKSYDSVHLHSIDKKDFNHGDTRNLGAEMTTGDYIAFLTHDACPADKRWLYNLVSAIEHFPDAAGAFGKHYAYDDASLFTKRDLNAHFDMLNNQPLCLTKDTDREAYEENPQWRQLLHFYSDNNSCMRREIWEKIPYRRVKFGEDQLWADDIIKAGLGKVYAPQAIVYHSHDYEPEENYERNMTESAFFKHFFGYELIKDEETLAKTLKDVNDHDAEWGRENGVSDEEIGKQMALNEARFKGYLDGVKADTSDMF
ncbi:glycosyltransferase [Kordiimonas sp. SCSIO 12610]|uniref:glycosyltransferase n=1 Tax=Kordiimonas sp. SCSIO 12610 TaxID=2829597 RepID=UPI00210D4060|nr:glycosyltransferase [Kordiimonas sp. SCSIO 12610]UTW56267.1 glycosyltransferase [Kordiimonas sp. SCSIO 12610]